jgi:hypothetical protein
MLGDLRNDAVSLPEREGVFSDSQLLGHLSSCQVEIELTLPMLSRLWDRQGNGECASHAARVCTSLPEYERYKRQRSYMDSSAYRANTKLETSTIPLPVYIFDFTMLKS